MKKKFNKKKMLFSKTKNKPKTFIFCHGTSLGQGVSCFSKKTLGFEIVPTMAAILKKVVVVLN